MATINRKAVVFRRPKIAKENKSAPYYNSLGWKRLRNNYLLSHPICEICEKKGVITPADDIHHISPFLSGANEEQRWHLLLDESNLMAVCSKCHYEIHKKMRNENS